MTDKTTQEKLKVLLPHWIDHNRGHGAEFRKWAEEASQEGLSDVAGLISQAAEILKEADSLLAEALLKVGGPMPHGHDHDHHHHHD